MQPILVVDDDNTTRSVLKAHLDHRYDQVYAAADGEEALALCRHQVIHILITDLEMPGLNGFELFSRAKQAHPMLRGICISAYLDYGRVASMMTAGFDDCIAKPIAQESLYASVDRSVGFYSHWQRRIVSLRHLRDADDHG
jgi:YesN/AraC family two-component response regulator